MFGIGPPSPSARWCPHLMVICHQKHCLQQVQIALLFLHLVDTMHESYGQCCYILSFSAETGKQTADLIIFCRFLRVDPRSGGTSEQAASLTLLKPRQVQINANGDRGSLNCLLSALIQCRQVWSVWRWPCLTVFYGRVALTNKWTATGVRQKVSCGLVVVKCEYIDNASFSCALVFAVSWDLQEWGLPFFFPSCHHFLSFKCSRTIYYSLAFLGLIKCLASSFSLPPLLILWSSETDRQISLC